ncbi:MAG: repeat-containing protein [Sediminibacterium sp.]|nr:repeat-containing protein [Sediminibacterium sp.]
MQEQQLKIIFYCTVRKELILENHLQMRKKNSLFLVRSAAGCIARYVLAVSFTVLVFSCSRIQKNKSHKDTPDASIEKGRVLATTHCQSCHLLPDPALLDAKTWETGVLPGMGPRLGIFYYGADKYPSYKNDKNLPANFYPDKPVLSSVDWQHIIDYYTALAPDSMPKQQRQSITEGLPGFKVQSADYTYPSPGICFTKIDTGSSPHQLFLFDMVKKYTFRFDNRLSLTDSAKTDATITDIDFRDNTMVACNINMINPNNGKFGKAQYLQTDARGKLHLDAKALFDSLARPVQITSCDLNNDKKTDYLVCEFGHLTGSLSWMENTGKDKFIHHVLRAEPGVLKAYLEDVNHDGLMDIWALFTQGNEAIVLFTNKGNGVFEQKEILRFPAIYGSTYFEFADFNKDGLQDIIYTCGDNADFSAVLKPYHGVYIYLNEGNNQFKQKYFFPINGCFKAMARDYDGDGDLDIAAISFFADYASPQEEGFVYLRNEGNFKFEPFTILESKTGRWLTMDVGDLDGDGKIDIVMSNFSIRPSSVKTGFDWKKGPPFIFLKNITK